MGEFTLTAEESREITRVGVEDCADMTATERERFGNLVTVTTSPKSLIGRHILKLFDGSWYSGVVANHNNDEGDEYVFVQYRDGDQESIHVSQISDFLVVDEEED